MSWKDQRGGNKNGVDVDLLIIKGAICKETYGKANSGTTIVIVLNSCCCVLVCMCIYLSIHLFIDICVCTYIYICMIDAHTIKHMIENIVTRVCPLLAFPYVSLQIAPSIIILPQICSHLFGFSKF